MTVENIQVGKPYLTSLAADFSKAASLIKFISDQIITMHDNNNGDRKHYPIVTLYQIHAILENLDARLMFCETGINEILGIPD
jgi:hypothetical protein